MKPTNNGRPINYNLDPQKLRNLSNTTKTALGIPKNTPSLDIKHASQLFPQDLTTTNNPTANLARFATNIVGAKSKISPYRKTIPTVKHYLSKKDTEICKMQILQKMFFPNASEIQHILSTPEDPDFKINLGGIKLAGIRNDEIRKIISEFADDDKHKTDFVQLTAISVIRHSASNAAAIMTLGAQKMMVDLSTFKLLYSGFLSRLTYQGVAVFPSIMVKDYLKDQGYSDTFSYTAAVLTESAAGIPLELYGYKDIFKKAGIGTNLKNLAKAELKALPAHLMRNSGFYLALYLISDQKTNDQPIVIEDVLKKIGYGAGLSAITTLPGSWGLLAIQNSAGRNFIETQEKVWEIVKKDGIKRICRGGLLRGISGALAAVAMLPTSRQHIENMICGEQSPATCVASCEVKPTKDDSSIKHL